MPDLIAQYGTEMIVFEDEMRYGTRTEAKKRWTRQGKRPQCPVKIGYEWGYLFVAIAPQTGELFAQHHSHFDSETFAYFGKDLQQYFGRPILCIADRATPHKQKNLPNDITYIPLPTATPELNPVERFFKDLRKNFKGRCFESLEQIQHTIDFYISQYMEKPQKVISITKFHWINNAA